MVLELFEGVLEWFQSCFGVVLEGDLEVLSGSFWRGFKGILARFWRVFKKVTQTSLRERALVLTFFVYRNGLYD